MEYINNETYQTWSKFVSYIIILIVGLILSMLLLNNQKISYTDIFKYLGISFSRDLNMSEFFIEKFQNEKISFFSLNSFGFKSNVVSPFLQSFVYKSFCISRILYGFEIMNLYKKTT